MAELDCVEVKFHYTGKRDLSELQRCARTLFSIPAGTLPMDREFGIRMDYMDRPMSVAINFYTAEVYEKVEKYLPECEISDISFSVEGQSGRMKPCITLTVKGE